MLSLVGTPLLGEPENPKIDEETTMALRDLLPGKLGFGTAPLGNMFRDIPDAEARATVDAAWSDGIRYFDTAPFYGAGLAELRLGAALAGKVRSDYRLSTKVGRIVLDELEAVGVPSLVPDSETRLIVIDEVGKMESFSEPFRQQVEALLDGPVPVLGTVAAHGVGFVKRVRQDGRVTLVRMSRRSREATPGEILRRLDLAPQPRTLSSPRR